MYQWKTQPKSIKQALWVIPYYHQCCSLLQYCSHSLFLGLQSYLYLAFFIPNPGLVSDTQGTVVQKRILPKTTKRCKLIYWFSMERSSLKLRNDTCSSLLIILIIYFKYSIISWHISTISTLLQKESFL